MKGETDTCTAGRRGTPPSLKAGFQARQTAILACNSIAARNFGKKDIIFRKYFVTVHRVIELTGREAARASGKGKPKPEGRGARDRERRERFGPTSDQVRVRNLAEDAAQTATGIETGLFSALPCPSSPMPLPPHPIL